MGKPCNSHCCDHIICDAVQWNGYSGHISIPLVIRRSPTLFFDDSKLIEQYLLFGNGPLRETFQGLVHQLLADVVRRRGEQDISRTGPMAGSAASHVLSRREKAFRWR